MGGVFLPASQKRLVNIAVVRMKKAGHRFEVACYPNKVLNWRNGVERDLDEVLQSRQVFSNVSKGVAARGEDLEAAFGTRDEDAICVLILQKGELQVSDKERQAQLEALFHEVATIVAEKCVDAATHQPITVSLVERALHRIHFNVVVNRSAKQQALEVIRQLEQSDMGIVRAQMRLRVTTAAAQAQQLRDLIGAMEGSRIQSTKDKDGSFEAVCTVNPGAVKALHDRCAGSCTVEVLEARAFGGEAVGEAAHRDEGGAGSSGGDGAGGSAQRPAAPKSMGAGQKGPKAPAAGAAAPKVLQCTTCPGASFPDSRAHREHFKSDWHKHNLSLKAKGTPSLTEEEYAEGAAELALQKDDDDFFK